MEGKGNKLWKKEEKRERKSSRFYFLEFTNESKVFTKDVTNSLNTIEITFFCSSEDFHWNKSIILYNKITLIN